MAAAVNEKARIVIPESFHSPQGSWNPQRDIEKIIRRSPFFGLKRFRPAIQKTEHSIYYTLRPNLTVFNIAFSDFIVRYEPFNVQRVKLTLKEIRGARNAFATN